MHESYESYAVRKGRRMHDDLVRLYRENAELWSNLRRQYSYAAAEPDTSSFVKDFLRRYGRVRRVMKRS